MGAVETRNLHPESASDYRIKPLSTLTMTWSIPGRKKELLAGIFLIAMTISNLVTVSGLVPFLRSGYQNFAIFYTAGKMVRDGRTASLYDLSAQYQVQQQFAPDVRIRKAALPYNHPPFEALFFVPLAGMPFWMAYLIWTALNLLMTAAALWVLLRHFAEVRMGSAVFLGLAATGFYPLVSAIVQGQDCILLLLAYVFAMVAFDKKQDVAAGAALAAGLFRFQLVLPLALILAFRRPRLLIGLVPVAGLWTAVSVLMVGWRGAIGYPSFLMTLEQRRAGGSIVVSGMPNVRGILGGLPWIRNGSYFLVALTLACSIAVVAIAIFHICKRRDAPVISFILATVAALLVSYHALAYDLSLLLPALLVLFHAREQADKRAMQMDVLLLVLLYLFSWFEPLGSSLTMLLWFSLLLLWLYRKRLCSSLSEHGPTIHPSPL
jgi:Glycosyltransferase family 87